MNCLTFGPGIEKQVNFGVDMERDRESGLPGFYFQLPFANNCIRAADDVDQEFVVEDGLHSGRPESVGCEGQAGRSTAA